MITPSIRNRISVAAYFTRSIFTNPFFQGSKSSLLRSASFLQSQQAYKHTKITSTMAQAIQTSKPEIAPNTADWESEWAQGIEKGMRWDIGKCEPELVYELSLKESGAFGNLFKRMSSGETVRGLVPGCGRGYAVTALGEAGLEALGLDLSPTATAIAEKESGRENAKFAVGDFFDSSVDHGQFDLIFDSTFLCAISPTMWRQWAKRMNELVAPQGYLAIHLFPVLPGAPDRDPDHPGDEPGPPNRLTVKLVRDLLHGYPFEETLLRRIPAERMARSLLKEQPVEEYWMIYQKK